LICASALFWFRQVVRLCEGLSIIRTHAFVRWGGGQETSDAAANAVGKAARVEMFMMPADYDEVRDNYSYDEELDEIARLEYKYAMRQLLDQGVCPDPCPMFAHASQHHTRPCPCGHGVLARWPWVVQTATLGFCDCRMAEWELVCLRGEWAGGIVAW
jgi:hypothetical protein